ncbi:ABC transporter permease [Azonexus fungiphilus]|uniref:ABC transporter permease n=1 Tax=Azonexus fungiphilus TaxID=146940 RepID=UPI003463DED6
MLVDNLLMFMSLFLVIIMLGGEVTLAMFGLIPAYILLFLFSFGLALVNAILSVYFRDLLHIIGVLMQAFIFLSPVYYKPQDLDSKLYKLIEVNPFTQFVELFRQPIFGGGLPSMECYIFSIFFAALSISFGIWFFRKYEHRVVFRM